jgi:NifU-like protein
VVCKCYGVTDKEIRRVAAENNLKTVEEVTNYTKAGGGCGLCHERIQEILEEVRGAAETGEAIPRPAQKIKEGLTNLQKMHLIERLFDQRIRPALKHDGGDAELVDIDHNLVRVLLKGACARCPSSNQTLRRFIEKEIQKEVSPAIRVEEVRA